MGSIWKNALIFSMAKKKVVINLVMAVWRSFLSLCDAACEMKNEAAATAAHETVPVLVALQAVCDVTRMVIHSWFRLAACSSFCLCVCVYRTHHRPSTSYQREQSQETENTQQVESFVVSQPGLPSKKNEWSFWGFFNRVKGKTVENGV